MSTAHAAQEQERKGAATLQHQMAKQRQHMEQDAEKALRQLQELRSTLQLDKLNVDELTPQELATMRGETCARVFFAALLRGATWRAFAPCFTRTTRDSKAPALPTITRPGSNISRTGQSCVTRHTMSP